VSDANWRSDLLKFWFGLSHEEQFEGDETLDHRIKQRFLKLWAEKRQLPVDAFVTDPLTALAAVILFDQLPRNMFRQSADQFATDHIALAIAKAAINKDFDKEVKPEERSFLYMPLQHSEDLGDQNRSVLLFAELGDDEQIGYAKKHRDIIERFGRFPHRNALLGRAPRPDELAAGDITPF
jgi:uncharacterized protein (DUF924 family)